ncbi:DUF1542 domain-containing protein, partial [Streptococcus pseudopneumoniae]|uniref:DUF1542 domain-containing protein n=1 Tax=Streptococcus pseudopneumoniae TaxID=257758 RepID=UPI000EEDDD47
GVNAINGVNPVGRELATNDITAKQNAKEAAITGNSKLSEPEKTKAKDEVKKAADRAREAIKNATNQAGVDTAQREGVNAINGVNPVGRELATNDITAKQNAKEAAITGNSKLSEPEKTKAKDEVKKAADRAREAIKN